MDTTLTRMARYITGLHTTRLPAQVLHEAKRRVIDSVACAAAAFDEPFCHQVRQIGSHYAHRLHSARIWGSGERTTLEMAAWVNGTQLRYLDLSDTILSRSNGHPSDMIGALVAMAESQGASGMALLQAIVGSYEVYASLCDAVPMASKGLDQATAAAVGTAAGAALLLQLSEVQTVHALSLGLSANLHLYNVRCGALSDWKGCAGPNGARNGVFAALLAQAGITGPSAPVQGKGGLQTVLGDFAWQPGQGRARILDTHLKLHPVCYHGQSAVDAALALREQVPWQAVERIAITTYEAAYLAMGSDPQRWRPSNRETADHSLPFVVATAWCEGVLENAAYSPQRLQSPQILALMDRIAVQPCPKMSADFPAQSQVRIDVTDTQGQCHSHTQHNPRGHALHPVDDAELEGKFRACFAPWGNAAQAQQTLDLLWTLDQLAQTSMLVDALVRSAAVPAATRSGSTPFSAEK